MRTDLTIRSITPVPLAAVTEITVQNIQRDDAENKCAICLDNYTNECNNDNIPVKDRIRQLSCGHQYHWKCIHEWLVQNKENCPYCIRKLNRAEIIDISRPLESDTLKDVVRRQGFNRVRLILTAVITAACFIFLFESLIESLIVADFSQVRFILMPIFGALGTLIGIWSIIECNFYLQKRKQIQSILARIEPTEIESPRIEFDENELNLDIV